MITHDLRSIKSLDEMRQVLAIVNGPLIVPTGQRDTKMLSEQVQDFRAGHKHLCRIVRKKPIKGKARGGIIIVFKDEEFGTINLGWSLCNDKAGDTFDKSEGFAYAIDKAEPFAYHDAQYDGENIDSLVESVINQCKVPQSLRSYARPLVRRAYSYYRLIPPKN